MKRVIAHVDMDCFFAAVEELDNPTIKGKPVIVGGSVDSRGVVSACNYEARKFGIHSAMPIVVAKRLCPNGIYLRGSMHRYQEVSKHIMAIFGTFTDRIEQISVDEAFLDLSGTERLWGDPKSAGTKIKNKIKEETGLTASVGISPLKFISKIASDFDKPDGLTIIKKDNILEFLHPLKIEKLWGVGKKSAEILHSLGIDTIRQLDKFPEKVLLQHLGEASVYHLKTLAAGKDVREVVKGVGIKTISHEHTFSKNISKGDVLRSAYLDMIDRVCTRLRKKDLVASTVCLTFRTADFLRYTRSKTLKVQSNLSTDILEACLFLYNKEDFNNKQLRLIGAGVSGLVLAKNGNSQMDLFSTEQDKEKERTLDSTLDSIKSKFGFNSVSRANINTYRSSNEKKRDNI